MDIRQYFRKIRETELALTDEFPIVVSLETPDGGKAGRLCEVTRQNAAKLIVEGRAVLATPEQKDQFERQREASRKVAETADMVKRMQFALLEEAALQVQAKSKSNGPSRSGN